MCIGIYHHMFIGIYIYIYIYLINYKSSLTIHMVYVSSSFCTIKMAMNLWICGSVDLWTVFSHM
jgi:hypothetical protein